MATVETVFNHLSLMPERIEAALVERLHKAAKEYRAQIKLALESGAHGIQNDTKALAESIYVSTPHGSDYDERLRAAAAAYLTNPSKWKELVQQYVTPSAYTAEHFQERVIGESPLPDSEMAIAAVSTMLAYGTFWEFGHSNVLTGKYEHRTWMGPEADAFKVSGWEACFHNLLEGAA